MPIIPLSACCPIPIFITRIMTTCRKGVGTCEMAVAIRARQLLEAQDNMFRKNKKITLNAKIKLILAEPAYTYFTDQLHLIRDFRDDLSHPADNSYMGGIKLRPIVAIINVINFIFFNVGKVEANQARSKELSGGSCLLPSAQW